MRNSNIPSEILALREKGIKKRAEDIHATITTVQTMANNKWSVLEQPRVQPNVQAINPRVQPKVQPRVQPRVQWVQPKVQPKVQPMVQPTVQPKVQPLQTNFTLNNPAISTAQYNSYILQLNQSQYKAPIELQLNQSQYRVPGNYISVKLMGGIGNRIFQVLAALGYSEKFQRKCVISRSNIYNGFKSHEQNLDHIISKIFPYVDVIDNLESITLINETTQFTYTPLIHCPTNVLLSGYFQNEQYFPSNKLIPSIKTSYYPNTYFIHIRAGDYLGTNEFHIDLVQYYKNCIALLDSSVKYIVFSNDNEYAKNYMRQFNVDYVLSDKTDQLEVLVEMANCEGGICANSSFSWLGAFFQDKVVGRRFMPSTWIKDRDCSGVYPKWATVINCNQLTIGICPPEITHSVSVVLSGGLGNRIFQIFAGLAYARTYGKKFVLCKSLYRIPEKLHENNTDTMIEFIFPNIEYVSSFTEYSIAQEKSHMDYNKLHYYKGNVLLNGYFQVEHYSLELERIPNIRTTYYDNTYFIHIRLGDYIGFYGMDFDLSNYHRRCINILGPDAKYIIFSNENDKAENYIKQFNINYTMSDKTDALESLIEMANCAGGICANSTFSWMGGFFQRQPRNNIFVPAKWVPNGIVTGIFPSWAARIEV